MRVLRLQCTIWIRPQIGDKALISPGTTETRPRAMFNALSVAAFFGDRSI